MLRILRGNGPTPNDATVRVRLVGQVRGQWVEELRRLCEELLETGVDLEIEMAEVSFVDPAGLRLFQSLTAQRVALVNCALFVAEQLKSLEQDVHHG